MSDRKQFDKYEAAILLNAYIRVENGEISRSKAVAEVSDTLRQRGQRHGIKLNKSYRNINGINFQYSALQYAMTGGKKGSPQVPFVFQRIVDTYLNKPDEYERVLAKALEDIRVNPDANHAEIYDKTSKKEKNPSEKPDEVNDIIGFLTNAGIECVDKRNRDGCLWIVGGKELEPIVNDMRNQGIIFRFKEKGARAINGQSGWWTKDCADAGITMQSRASDENAINVRLGNQKPVLEAIPRMPNSTIGFRDWMIELGLAESSARSYSSAINNAEQFARERGYSDIRFYGNNDTSSVRQMIDRLFADDDFVAYNEGQHNRFRAAFRKFIDFIGDGTLTDISPSTQTKVVQNDILPSHVRDALLSIVSEWFPNGVRLRSVIDRKKIARLYKEKTSGDAPKDEDVEACLMQHGILLDGKLYLIGMATKQAVRELMEAEVSKGYRIFYYEELYSTSAEYYTSKTIYSADALKRVIKESGVQLICYKNYCATARDVSIEDELVRAYGGKVQATVDELKERLPFIPEDKLISSLSLSKKFVRVRAGEYARIDGIEINEGDVNDARALVEDEIAKHGFASLGSIDLTRTLGDNPMLSEAAIRDAFFAKVLSRNYSKKGQIVTHLGESASANDVMRESCRSLTSATLEELDDLEKSITGQARNAILPIAFETMVRTGRDTFVSNELVDFDADAVDAALDFFVGENIAPIRAVSSFNSFPYVGQPWTLYLLESYISRYSKRYKISGGPARTDNVGAVYPKELSFDNYGELLAHVLARSSLDLGGSEATDYLIRAGFVLRKTALVRTAIERARILRDFEGR